MIVSELRPAIGNRYRHRRTGRIACLWTYRLDRGMSEDYGAVVLRDGGWDWCGSVADFWDEWIHADAFNEQDN